MAKVLVTGAGGFIGGHLSKRLAEQGHDVWGADIKMPEFRSTEDIGIPANQFIIADLRYGWTVEELMYTVHPEWIFALAADMGGMGFVSSNDERILRNNLAINLNTYRAAHDLYLKGFLQRYFFSSSVCVYPEQAQMTNGFTTNMVEEDAHPANPQDAYGWEKLTTEQLLLAAHQDLGFPTYIARFHNCYDEKTEVLTDRGWVNFANLLPGDKVASQDEDGCMIFVLPVAHQVRFHDGPMVQIKHNSVDLLTTVDHAHYWSSNANPHNYRREPLPDLAAIYMSQYVQWKGEDVGDSYTLPEYRDALGRLWRPERTVPLDKWCSLVGWYLAEGSAFRTSDNHIVCITQLPGKKHAQILQLLEELGITYYINTKDPKEIRIHDVQIFTAIYGQCGSKKDKHIPRWMLNLPVRYLQTLYDAMMAGDGHTDGRAYSTVCMQDDFQELALRLGKRPVISGDRVLLSDRVHPSIRKQHRSITHYTGKVYDVTVPTQSHLLLVRRNGKPVWSGNCYGPYGTWQGGREKAPAAMCRKVANIMTNPHKEPVIEVWGDGQQIRPFVYVDDLVEAILLLTQSDYHKPVNLGPTWPWGPLEGPNYRHQHIVSIDTLAAMVAEVAGLKHFSIEHVDGPEGVRYRGADGSLMKRLTGWEPSTPLLTGLSLTYEWIEQQVLHARMQGAKA